MGHVKCRITRWAITKRFLDGTFITATPAYGYKNDEDGNLIIDNETAPIVKRIFREYLNGKGSYLIAKDLEESGIPTIRGAKRWWDDTINGILQNEVYKGDRLYQKTYTTMYYPFTVKRIADSFRNILSKITIRRLSADKKLKQ